MTNTNSSKRPRRMAREPKTETVSAETKVSAVSGEHEVQPAQSKRPSKAETVLTLLRQPEGATLDDLVAATGWLPHTTRAAMTGLKKKGHQITRTKLEGVSRYTISETASR